MSPNRPLELFTTSDCADGASAALSRMIVSVERFRAAHPHVALRSHMLLQRVAADAQRLVPDWIDVTTIESRVSLSKARNLMLAKALSAGIADDAIVAFPDDDAWYPAGTLEHIMSSFGEEPDLDLWFCRYGTKAAAAEGVPEDPAPGLQQALSFASSNTTVVSGRLLKLIGGFDEALGVGTPAGGGEDTEFTMRAFHAARSVRFWDVEAVGHRDGDASIRAKYYAGSLRAIALHGNASWAARVAMTRKIAVGAALVMLQRLGPRDYFKSLKAARR